MNCIKKSKKRNVEAENLNFPDRLFYRDGRKERVATFFFIETKNELEHEHEKKIQANDFSCDIIKS